MLIGQKHKTTQLSQWVATRFWMETCWRYYESHNLTLWKEHKFHIEPVKVYNNPGTQISKNKSSMMNTLDLTSGPGQMTTDFTVKKNIKLIWTDKLTDKDMGIRHYKG
jgi:hypothetical protein